MDTNWILSFLVSNTISASVLAAIVLVASRFVRSPSARFWLWMVVLLKLVTPTMFTIELSWFGTGKVPVVASRELEQIDWTKVTGDKTSAMVPTSNRPEASSDFDLEQDTSGQVGLYTADPKGTVRKETAASIDWIPIAGQLVLAIWIIGVGVVAILMAVRFSQFAYAMRSEGNQSENLDVLVRNIAARWNLRSVPKVVEVNAHIPPLLWWPTLRPTIVVPQTLCQRIDDANLRSILAHELAHYRRGDHLLRWVQSAIVLLHWWNPIAWFVLRNLKQAEEESCDEIVVNDLPDQAKEYAKSLMDTIDFMAESRPIVPPLATSFSEARHLNARIRQILSPQIAPMSNVKIASTIIVALLFLPWSVSGETPQIQQLDKSINVAPIIDQFMDSQAPGLDRYNDALPLGATMRLGSTRYRHSGWYKRIAWTADEEVFAEGTNVNTVRMSNAVTGKMVREIELDGEALPAWAISRSGNLIATLSFDVTQPGIEKLLRLITHDVHTGKTLRSTTISWNQGDPWVSIKSMAVSPDVRLVAIGTQGRDLRIYDLDSGELVRINTLDFGADFESLEFSPDGQNLAIGLRQVTKGSAHVGIIGWPFRSSPDFPPNQSPRPAQVLRYSPDGSMLAIGSMDDTAPARIWNIKEKQWMPDLSGTAGKYNREGLCFSNNGRQLFVPSNRKEVVEVFDVASGQLQRTLAGNGAELRNVAVSPSGKYLAAQNAGNLRQVVWNLESGDRVSDRFDGHIEQISNIAFSQDDGRVYSGDQLGEFMIWNAQDSTLQKKLQHGNWVYSLAVSNNGLLLATCSGNDSLKVWNTETFESVHDLSGHGKYGGNRHYTVAFSEEGTKLNSFGIDLMLRTWDMRTGKLEKETRILPPSIVIPQKPDGRVDFDVKGEDVLGLVLDHILSSSFVANATQLVIQVDSELLFYNVETGMLNKTILVDNTPSKVSPDGSKYAFLKYVGDAKDEANAQIRLVVANVSDNHVTFEADVIGKSAGRNQLKFSSDSNYLAISLNRSAKERVPKDIPRFNISVWSLRNGSKVLSFDSNEANFPVAFSHANDKLAVGMIGGDVCLWPLR